MALVACFITGAQAAQPPVGGGLWHSGALGADGRVRTWGDDGYGQLGIGRPLYSLTPAAVSRANDVKAVAAGWKHVLALKTDGSLLAWGQNQDGELGDGSTDNRPAPVVVVGLTSVTAVCAGNGLSAALRTDRSVWTWGGYVGRRPIRVDGIDDVAEISCGRNFILARRGDGSVWAWGENESGQLGDGTQAAPYVVRLAPRLVAGLTGVVQVAAGDRHALARLADGSVRAWGNNETGALGDGTITNRLTPVVVAGLGRVATIAAGLSKSFAIQEDGKVLAWGNGNYRLGDGVGGNHPTPVTIAGLSGVSAIAPGLGHSFAVLSGGTLVAWGNNDYGQLGDGTLEGRKTPSPMTAITGVVVVAVGQAFTIALKADGSVYAWGDNTYGQLGNDAVVVRSTPSVVTLEGVKTMAVGAGHTVALKADGSLWAWGGNIAGQIGDGTTVNRSIPVAVTGLGAGSGIIGTSAGEAHTLAFRSDGSLFSWGDNYSEGLGERESTNSAIPSRLKGLSGVIAASAGWWGQSMALKDDGTVWTWGHNNSGQLGDGTRSDLYVGRSTPMAVSGLTNVRAIAAGRAHMLALKADGTLWAWGGNANAQLGDGTRVDRLRPVRVLGLDNIVEIGAGYFHSLARKGDGTVWIWGGSWSGNPAPPEQVRGLGAITAISASAHSMALSRDGIVWAWGRNEHGQLGDGTLVDRTQPVAVLREGGAGSVAGNDWFLDIDPAVASTIPVDRIPVFLVAATATAADITANIRFRSEDIGRSASLFVFGLAPATIVKDGPGIAIGPRAKYADGKDSHVQCVLAQLNSAGQMVAVTSANLVAYLTGVLSAQGQAVSILNNTPPVNIAGTTFFVGYGASGGAMISSGTNRGVVTVPGSVTCQPQAPQKGWWWNPLEDGRGFSVEVRGNNLFFASFLYDISGRSTWYVSTGPVSLDGSFYSGDLLGARGGQTLGGAYPGFPTLQSLGNVTLAFSSATTGTMIWPGGTVPIQRFNIVNNGVTLGSAANMPESGWWWNENEPGRGFFMEWQGNTLDIAGYMYDDAGNPVWYLTVGDMASNGTTFSGSWWSYGNGQTLTGPWKPNTRLSTTVAPMTLTFSGPDTALMTLPNGRSTALRRHRF